MSELVSNNFPKKKKKLVSNRWACLSCYGSSQPIWRSFGHVNHYSLMSAYFIMNEKGSREDFGHNKKGNLEEK